MTLPHCTVIAKHNESDLKINNYWTPSELLKYFSPLSNTCCLLSSACVNDDLQPPLPFAMPWSPASFYLGVHTTQRSCYANWEEAGCNGSSSQPCAWYSALLPALCYRKKFHIMSPNQVSLLWLHTTNLISVDSLLFGLQRLFVDPVIQQRLSLRWNL